MPTIQLQNPSGTVSTTGSLSTASDYSSMFGTSSAAVICGGNTAYGSYASGTKITRTELFNGSTWSGSGALNASRQSHGTAGTSSAGLAGGSGNSPVLNTCELFNGSAWSNAASGNFQAYGARYNFTMFGVQNAAMCFAGWNSSGDFQDSYRKMEFFNGTSWSVGATFFTNVNPNYYGSYGGVGTQNDALTFGGDTGSVVASCYYWNGSTWSARTSLPAIRSYLNGGAGTTSAAYCFGGYNNTAGTNTIYSHNGSTWSTSSATLTANSQYNSSCGSSASSLCQIGGNSSTSAAVATVNKFVAGDPSPLNVAEPVIANANIATLSAAEAGMVFTLVSGTGSTDNGSFSISGTNLNTLVDLDYETKNSYSIRINATNGTTTYQNVLVISVTDVAEAPTNITLSSNSIVENNSINDVIGTLAAVDQDGAPHTFSIVLGGSNFNISGNQLRASVVFDYETQTSYSVTVRATDSASLTYDKAFTINILNSLADDPIALDPVANSVKVLSSGAVIATVNGDPRVASISYNNQALVDGSIIKNSQNNQKFIKISGNYYSYTAIEITPKAEWSWSSGASSIWTILQNL
jgi:hypothetical protein